MRYMQSYKFAFQHPQWAKNWLFGALCCAIPVVGPIVHMGWMFEVIEGFIRRGESTWSIFEFGNFGRYLTRGVWPFLVNLILGLVVAPIMAVFAVLWVLFIISSKGKPDPVLFTIFLVALMLAGFVLGLFLNFIKIPMLLRAGLTQELGPAFSMGCTLDFMKKMWVEIILAGLFLMVTSLPLVLLGELCCFVGLFPAVALLSMAEHHLYYQLYTLYLQRGGIAIPLKPEPDTLEPEPPSAVV
jgi:uncharacterized protein DUF4013